MTCQTCGRREALKGYVTWPTPDHAVIVNRKPPGKATHLCRICIATRATTARMTRLRLDAGRK